MVTLEKNTIDAMLNRRAWLAALCCAAPLAACQAPGNDKAPAFEDIDTNANGMISIVEAKQHDAVMRDFKQLDSNSDGSLDKIEYAALTSNSGNAGQKPANNITG